MLVLRFSWLIIRARASSALLAKELRRNSELPRKKAA